MTKPHLYRRSEIVYNCRKWNKDLRLIGVKKRSLNGIKIIDVIKNRKNKKTTLVVFLQLELIFQVIQKRKILAISSISTTIKKITLLVTTLSL